MYQITLEIQRTEEGPYLGTSPDLPGLVVQGATLEQVVELAPDVARELISVMIETGQPMPPGLHRLSSPTRVQLVVTGVTCAELTRKLRALGCVLECQAKGSHEIWHNPRVNRSRGDLEGA